MIFAADNVGAELLENLGMIEEVGNYIKVTRASALVSLDFLRNLRVIHGNQPYNRMHVAPP